MKKGGIHIDWVISIGLFILFIIIILILVKPGSVKPEVNKVLLGILEDGIEKNPTYGIRYEVLKIPFYVSGTASGPTQTGNEVEVGVALPSEATVDDVKIMEDSVEKTVTDVSSSAVQFIPGPLQATPVLFILYYSKDKYPGVEGSGTGTYSGYTIAIQVGSAEKFVGIDEGKLENKCPDDDAYNAFKAALNYPPSSELAVYVATSLDPNGRYTLSNDMAYCKLKSPYEGADVIVKEKRDWVLNPEDLSITPAIINLQVW